MNDDNINDYLPSILNPRAVRKRKDFSLTQSSVASRFSLSLKRPNGLPTGHPLNENSIVTLCPLSIKRPNGLAPEPSTNVPSNKENLSNISNVVQEPKKVTKVEDNKVPKNNVADTGSLGFSAIEDLISNRNDLSIPSLCDDQSIQSQEKVIDSTINACNTNDAAHETDAVGDKNSVKSYLTLSSATELDEADINSESTVIYHVDKPTIKVSFSMDDCASLGVNVRNVAINSICFSHKDNSTNVDCEVIECSQISTESLNSPTLSKVETEMDKNLNEAINESPRKRPAVAVNLEIKKRKLTNKDSTENSKVLILNTNAIEKISHVIVQPPNYKFVKRNISHIGKYRTVKSGVKNGNVTVDGVRLKQASIEDFVRKGTDATIDVGKQLGCVTNDGGEEMSKNVGVLDAVKCDHVRQLKANKSDANDLPKSARLPSNREFPLSRKQEVKVSHSDAPSPRLRSTGSNSPRKNVESIHFNLPAKSKSNKSSLSPKIIPHHKIVAGTHFAVDAFSYGEIPNVNHYFLTHFHSDHYSGLKKGFSKFLFCSKITADLCISRLGVNPKYIHIINIDETLRIEGVEVAALDANHCPGALMLMFTLPNGKTLLHTGDFRASPEMESYPLFWNRDIHTIYLDTTYCNPRYDFPTQDESLEMAIYILRQKKMALEKVGKKFTSVLIVCGTYTIGKEKFFVGLSRRVGCAVWACPEKERVLRAVRGRAAEGPPRACQLHVVPMRDLTHEKLRSYLDSLQGAFSEVVAFKPSGWENGKNSSIEKDLVTIHGIPYSEHSSFSELIRFVKFLRPKQVVPTVDISGGIKAVQKYFPCPLVYKEEIQSQAKVTDYFSIHSRQHVTAVT